MQKPPRSQENENDFDQSCCATRRHHTNIIRFYPLIRFKSADEYSFRDFSKKRYFYSTSLPWFFKSSIQQSSIINSFWRIFVPHLPRYFRGSNLRVEYFAYRISLTPQSSPPVYLITCLSMIPISPPPASTGNRQTIRLSDYQTIRLPDFALRPPTFKHFNIRTCKHSHIRFAEI